MTPLGPAAIFRDHGIAVLVAFFSALIATVLLSGNHEGAAAFKLSSLFGQSEPSERDDEEFSSQFSYPRRDLVAEFGEEGYERRVADALGIHPDEAAKPTGTPKRAEYGVDVSFPIHHSTVSYNFDYLDHNAEPDLYSASPEFKEMPLQILGDRQAFYENLMRGCRDHYGKKRGKACDSNERDRIRMNLRQPQSMQNYTDIGFKKIRAPAKVYRLLSDFYERNKGKETLEKWSEGNTYTNHWESPTSMLRVEDDSLRGGGHALKNRIWDAARDTLQKWTGESLTPSSLYGVRIYKEGAVLAPHVDRLPLVSSAIINVAQDVDEDWPLEVYGHDGKAYNVTMKPGDMVLYESHSVLHGRPFPLRGQYYANVFIHFEPTGHTLRHEERLGGDEGNVEDLYAKALKREEGRADDVEAEEDGGGGGERDDLPAYIMRGTPEEKRWRQEHGTKQRRVSEAAAERRSDVSPAHMAASNNHVDELRRILTENPDAHKALDDNGWQPIHEAARGGHTEAVKLLVERGADVNVRTNKGKGATALWWAEARNGPDHPTVKYLKSVGAMNVGPDRE